MRNVPLSTLSFVAFFAAAVALHAGAGTTAGSAASSSTSPVSTGPDRAIALDVRVPDGGWVISIEEVWRMDDRLVVVARANRPQNVLGAQMVCTMGDVVSGQFPDLPTHFVLLGRNWNTATTGADSCLDEKSDIYRNRRKGERLFKRKV